MTVNTIKQTFEEVDEITLIETGQLIASLDKIIGSERLLAVAHNLHVPVFFDYKISFDGGVTFYPPHVAPSINANDHCRMFADDSFLYFDYYNAGGGTATQCTWRYRLFIIETKQ